MTLIEEARSYRCIAHDLGISKNTALTIAKRENVAPIQAQNL